jgi:threonyl-tRNA synthetase
MSISSNSQNLSLDTKRHSMAHIMAAAVGQMFPEAQYGVGPVIENGCYYDFILPRTLIPEDLPLIEEKMRELLKRHLSFKRQEISIEEAIIHFENAGQPLKVELLNDLRTKGTTSMSEEERESLTSKSKIKNIILDFGDVVFEKQHVAVVKYLKSEYSLEDGKDYLGKKAWEESEKTNSFLELEFWQNYAVKIGLENSDGANLFDKFINSNDTIKEVEDFIKDKKQKGYKLFYLTNTKEKIFETRTKAEIFSLFDGGVTDIEAQISKPEKEIYKFLLDKYSINSGESIFIDDLKNNVEAAKEAGLNGIHFIKGETNLEQEFSKLSSTTPTITLYRLVDENTGEIVFEDLCKGPHIEHVKELKHAGFALDKFSASYWRGDQERDIRMQRIYALVFETKEELTEFQTAREEAKKRDHRVLNETQKYYTISDLVGSGLALFQPNGNIIRKNIQAYLWQLHKNKNYKEVWTPHMAKELLYQTSGHAKHYLDDMFSVYGGTSKENFYLKPMNCPHHMQLFADNQFSYRDMPIRYFEHATVYRDEKTGQLSGLTRVRNITQDDGHLFARLTQLEDEVSTIVEIIKEFMATFGMEPKWVSLSVRDSSDNWLGTNEMWETAEKALKQAAIKHNIPHKVVEGEAAFYGPKLDFMFTDVIGRQQQLSTIQIDFNLPERFNLSFVNENGEDERPVVIHRAIAGSAERFMGVLIEHFGGRFPFWLAPTQVKILTINTQPETLEYVEKVTSILNETVLMRPLKYNEIRFEVDDRSESLGKKIREAEMQKIPVLIIVGPKDIAENQVSVRTQEGESKVGVDGLSEFLKGV